MKIMNEVLPVLAVIAVLALVLTSGCLSIFEPIGEGIRGAVNQTGELTCGQICNMCQACNGTSDAGGNSE